MNGNDHRVAAIEAVEKAHEMLPPANLDIGSAQVHATTAIAEVLLATHDVLIDIRDRPENLRP
jgi:hypothetical protein